jgi:hypothetical protein
MKQFMKPSLRGVKRRSNPCNIALNNTTLIINLHCLDCRRLRPRNDGNKKRHPVGTDLSAIVSRRFRGLIRSNKRRKKNGNRRCRF